VRLRLPGVPIGLLVALAVVASACTSGGSTDGAGSSGPSTIGSETPVASATAYTYTRGGVSANLRYTSGEGVLTVTNKSGGELPAPGVYLLRADDGRRVEGRLSVADALPDGATRTYRVTFATELAPRDVGLIVLLIGRDNYGAFIPPTD
jgi:hypothetical protein